MLQRLPKCNTSILLSFRKCTFDLLQSSINNSILPHSRMPHYVSLQLRLCSPIWWLHMNIYFRLCLRLFRDRPHYWLQYNFWVFFLMFTFSTFFFRKQNTYSISIKRNCNAMFISGEKWRLKLRHFPRNFRHFEELYYYNYNTKTADCFHTCGFRFCNFRGQMC
jgi:hypothetical protein